MIGHCRRARADESADQQVAGQRQQEPCREPVDEQTWRTLVHGRSSARRTKNPATWRSASRTTRPNPSVRSSAESENRRRCNRRADPHGGRPTPAPAPPGDCSRTSAINSVEQNISIRSLEPGRRILRTEHRGMPATPQRRVRRRPSPAPLPSRWGAGPTRQSAETQLHRRRAAPPDLATSCWPVFARLLNRSPRRQFALDDQVEASCSGDRAHHLTGGVTSERSTSLTSSTFVEEQHRHHLPVELRADIAVHPSCQGSP